MGRYSEVYRKTSETDIKLKFSLDGKGNYKISSGVRFFDHMLELFSKHGRFDMELECNGDLDIDTHHSVEDIGISLGQAINETLGDKAGIVRYATTFTPMDEALCRVALDLSGRGILHFDADFTRERVGDFETEMVEEFFRSLAVQAGITVHIKVEYGKNNHHMIESIFKGFARALRDGSRIDETIDGVMSTKGML